MWLNLEKIEEPKLSNSTMVVAVSTSMPQYRALYSQAREMGEHMLKKMEFNRIATVHSSAFPPEVLVREGGVSTLPACHFYQGKRKKNLILFAGDASPMDEQYEFAQVLLDYADSLGVKELYSVGARWAENPLSPEVEPEASGFSTDKTGVAKLKKAGVKVLAEEPAPFFASMVVALAGERGMRGYKLSVDHGEPSPHVKSVAKLLGALSTLAGIEVPLDELKSKVSLAPPARRTSESTIYQ